MVEILTESFTAEAETTQSLMRPKAEFDVGARFSTKFIVCILYIKTVAVFDLDDMAHFPGQQGKFVTCADIYKVSKS